MRFPAPLRRLTLAATIALIFLGACRAPPAKAVDPAPLEVAPRQLDLGTAYVGAPLEAAVQVSNPSRVDVLLALAVTGPFELPGRPASVSAGASLTLAIRFSPPDAGRFFGALFVADAGVALEGRGLLPEPCLEAGPCRVTRFDPDAGYCVSARRPDGTDCASSFACFASAVCEGGECVGTLARCDDGNPCTRDECGPAGCEHPSALASCPVPSDPCAVAWCDPDAGCGSVVAADGTPCGAATCTRALVCVNDQCVVRATPGASSCPPSECELADAGCGPLELKDGGVAACGVCTGGLVCDARTRRCSTPAAACADASAQCGAITDACGFSVNCPGTCPAPKYCSGSTCVYDVCVPKDCASLGAQCGLAGDGCGGLLDCGRCLDDGGCVANRCPNPTPCVPKTCAALGFRCGGPYSNDCGGLSFCGLCPGALECGAPGTAAQGTCRLPLSCRAEGAECGPVQSACGPSVDCGGCDAGLSCRAHRCAP